MHLKEDFLEKLSFDEKKSDGSVVLKSTFAVGGKVNGNNRVYPREILKREVNRMKGILEKGNTVFAVPDHDKDFTVNNVSHLITNLEYDDSTGKASAKIKILDTEKGKNVLAILKNGGKLGLSMEGSGSVKHENGIDFIESDYKMSSISIVLNPSFGQDAKFNRDNVIGESLEYVKVEERKNTNTLTRDQISQKYSAYRQAGFTGSRQEFIERIINKDETEWYKRSAS